VRKRTLLAASLLVVAVVAGLAVWEMRPKVSEGRRTASRSDYILENFELTSLDADGHESFSVKAPHLERDPGGKSLTIRQPQFSFPDKHEGRWLVTSNSAWVAEKGVEVRLIDKVEMLGPPSPRGERTRFSTARLQIFPNQNLALSQGVVTISRADSILHGTGLRADMQSHHIQLLANVKGRYAPPRP
jgi:lipopolysaccharide export system protein LptC